MIGQNIRLSRCREAPKILLLADLSLRLLACALLTLSLFAVPGCVVPVRLPTQTKGTSGNPQQFDFTFLTAGSTTRDEITNHLAVIDTGVKEKDFFWGRWDRSKWGIAAMGPLAGGAGRLWRMHNLLIQLDQNGLVKTWAVVDDKNLDHELDLFDPGASDSPLDLSSPLHAQARYFFDKEFSDLVLTSDTLEWDFRREADDKFWRLKTARTNLRMIVSTPGGRPIEPQPDLLVATVYFAKPAVFAVYHHGKETGHFTSKDLGLAVDPPTFLLLRRYMKQTKHDASTATPPDGMNASVASNRKP
jgi:hypothetical protein